MTKTPSTSSEEGGAPGSELPAGWTRPTLDKLPRPTYWPMALAFGVIFALGGIVTSYVVSLVGVGMVAVAITGWVGELRHERRS